MVIHELNVIYISGRPAKAHTPLIVNADAELACTVSLQRLQAVARWRAQKIKSCRSVQLNQLALSHPADALPAPGTAAFEQSLSVLITKALDHRPYYISIFDMPQVWRFLELSQNRFCMSCPQKYGYTDTAQEAKKSGPPVFPDGPACPLEQKATYFSAFSSAGAAPTPACWARC
jgi:hypothetical protein